jgi:CO/xanthine dehydrogenase FAD-binding subunit
MKPARFRYVRPTSLPQALAALAESDGEARVLAGGQSLVPMLNMRLVRPDTLVDVNGVAGLASIGAGPSGSLVLGALVRHTDLIRAPLVCDRAPLLVEATRHIGHMAIRNRGTLGGSLAHADPAAELPAAAVALDATLVLASPRGSRAVPAGDFFRGLYATAVRPDEMLVEVRVPPQEVGWGFAEVARRPGDFALAGVAAALRPAAGAARRCAEARIVGFGLGQAPVRLREAEALLVGATLDARAAERAGAAAAGACDPPSDVHASSDYRRHLASVLTEGVVLQAIARLDRSA